jgi:hypothetical protein
MLRLADLRVCEASDPAGHHISLFISRSWHANPWRLVIINSLFASGSRGAIAYLRRNRSAAVLFVHSKGITQTIYLDVGQVSQS